MEQVYDYHIWTEQSPVSIRDIVVANGKAHGVNPSQHTIDVFEKKIVNAYWGKALLAYATPQNNPKTVCGAVAYGVYSICINGKTVNGGIAYTSFVVPEYQGKGIFKKLILFAQQKCKENGYAILISFPNAKSISGYRSAGWTAPAGILKHMLRPGSLKSIFRWILHYKDLKKGFDATLPNQRNNSENYKLVEDIFKNRAATQSLIKENYAKPNRSEGFYKWRLCEHPQSDYGIEIFDNDYIIYRRGFRGKLCEIQLLDYNIGADYKKRMRVLTSRIVKKERADILTLRISAQHPLCKVLKQMHFIEFGKNSNLNFSYLVFDENLEMENTNWIISGLDFHMA